MNKSYARLIILRSVQMLKNIFIFSMLLAAVFATSHAKASEQTLLSISNDDGPTSYALVIDTSEDQRLIKELYKDTYENGKKIERINLDYRSLSNNGMVLDQRGKYITIKLESNNFDEQQGGVIAINTLYNGATGSRKVYEISLSKDNNGWAIISSKKSISKILIQVNKVRFVGTVGIKNLIMK